MEKGKTIALFRLSAYDERSVIGGDVFYANNRLLMDAAGEFQSQKDWTDDMYFYLAQKL